MMHNSIFLIVEILHLFFTFLDNEKSTVWCLCDAIGNQL